MLKIISCIFLVLISFPISKYEFSGTSWQTYSESEYEQRIYFEDDFFIFETREINTETLATHCTVDTGVYKIENEELYLKLDKNAASYMIDSLYYSQNFKAFRSSGANIVLTLVKISSSHEYNVFKKYYFQTGIAGIFDEAWNNFDCKK